MIQGFCSNCHKVWVLETEQGLCRWCGKPSACQSSTTKPRSIKSRANGRKRQAEDNGNGYDQLEGDWLAYYNVASKFSHKANHQDREDLRQDIIVRLAEVARNNGHKPLTEGGMIRVASYVVMEYWHNLKRKPTILSLDYEIEDGEGDTIELWQTLADDKAIDLDAWLDSRTFLLGCPKRLVQIAHKRVSGIPLTDADRLYLSKWHRKAQKRLL